MATSAPCTVVIACLVLILQLQVLEAFPPNQLGTRYLGSKTHEQITKNAIRSMAEIFIRDHHDRFPDEQRIMSSRDFVVALSTFERGTKIASTEEQLINLPSAHFDSEQIVESNQRILELRVQVISAMNGGDMTKAQELTGQLFHTLQDFYSHSNWIEMGNNQTHKALADPAALDEIGPVATLNQPTCTDCPTKTCRNNIRADINRGKILTSGYVYLDVAPTTDGSFHDPNDYKPAGKGKCSRGGKGDITSSIPATGGINKDTNSEEYSPHHYHHTQAADLAEAASLEFLKSIRSIRSEDEFAKYLGLSSGSSLCFIIDTTGSMSDDIDAVRQWTIQFTRLRSDGSNPPSDYVLVPFNDPGYGPVHVTGDSEQMITWLNGLIADGGGDGPELFFHGMKEAVLAVRPGSTCFAFTDAPAKDVDLYPLAVSLAVSRRVTVFLFMTGGSFRRRKKRSTSGYDYYDGLVAATGGQIFTSTKSDISETVRVIEYGISTTQVTLSQKDNVAAGTLTNHSLPIDQTLSAVTVSITGSITDVVIRNAEGAIEPIGSPEDNGTVIQVTDTSQVKVYSISSPTAGMWTIQVSASGQYSISVTGQSLVSFSYKFVQVVGGAMAAYKEVDGKPSSVGEQIIIVNIQGGHTDGGISGVSSLVLLATDGTELQRHPLLELEPLEQYELVTSLPSQGFRVVLEGADSEGNLLQRCNPDVVYTSPVAVQVTVDTSGRFTAAPGEQINVTILVNNTGSSNETYTLSVSDSANFFNNISPSQLTVEAGKLKRAVATFEVPNDISLGTVSTVTVLCTGTEHSNYVIFRIDTSPENVDWTAPVCTVDDTTKVGDCSDTRNGIRRCDEDIWSVHFQAEDTGLGVYNIKTLEAYSEATLTVDPFESGTNVVINGSYVSDCCLPRVTITVSDQVGNVAKCYVEYDTTRQSEPSCCRNWYINLAVLAMTLLLSIYN